MTTRRSTRNLLAHSLIAAVGAGTLASSAGAVVIPVAAGWNVSTFDTGGILNPGLNGGHTLGGLEVDPAGGRVYVIAHNVGIGGTSTTIGLLSSTGLGTAAFDGGGFRSLQHLTRANDLTHLNGQYYVAANRPINPGFAIPGVYGLTPGLPGFSTFAEATAAPAWATSGLTFETQAVGTTAARVTSDVGIGHHVIPAGATFWSPIVNSNPLPTGYAEGSDDHVVSNGRVIVAGDGFRRLYDVTAGAGAVVQVADLTTMLSIPDAALALNGFGSRATVDPLTGDIYYALAAGGGNGIVRIDSTFSSAEVIATGFEQGVRDMDWGFDAMGNWCLFATEVNHAGIGTIYTFKIPAPGSVALLGLAGVLIGRRRR